MKPPHVVMLVVTVAIVSLLVGTYICPSCPPCVVKIVKTPPKPKMVVDGGCAGGCLVELLGPGYVRSIDLYRNSVVYETEYGFVKALDPVCDSTIPMWRGMRLNRLGFHWKVYGNTSFNGTFYYGCYKLDDVEHSLEGDLKAEEKG
jgi:hypothetical protein